MILQQKSIDYEVESESLKSDFEKKLKKSELTEDDILFLLATFGVASQIHREEQRKTGRSYLYHPFEVGGYLADIGMGPITIAGGLLHDTAESYNERSGMTTREALYHVEKIYRGQLEEVEIPSLYLESYLPDVMQLVDVLTRRKGEIYYASMDRILALDPLNRSRALIIKSGGDRRFNVQEMRGFSPQRKLYSIFKSIYIVHEIKRLLLSGERIPFREKVEKAFEDLISFSNLALNSVLFEVSFEHVINPEEAVKLTDLEYVVEDYYRAGGFCEITEPSDNPFDGIVGKYDRMIRGDIDHERLEQSDIQLYVDALSFKQILKLLRIEKDYFIEGFRSYFGS